MSHAMDLQSALNRIQELELENQKLKLENDKLRQIIKENEYEFCSEISELKEEISLREGDENILCTTIQEMKDEINELNLRMENVEQNNYDDGIRYPEADSEEDAEWYDLKVDSDYEICNWFSYNIRKKSNDKIIGEWIDKQNGYIKVALNRKPYCKHIFVAKQFIPNPHHLPFVDHQNHQRNDYRISNLRWVSVSDNNNNKYGINGIVYEYIDVLPNNCQQITLFRGWEFDNYFISSDNKIWFYNGNQYRELKVYTNRNYKYVDMLDINNKHHNIGLNALIQEYN